MLKQGRIRIPHFAHHPGTTCLYGGGETELHRKCKLEIYDALTSRPYISALKLERHLQGVRPDVSFKFNDLNVAVEVQISTLPLEVVEYRTCKYRELGVYLLWTSPLALSRLGEDRYAPRAWEKYLHSLYFGRVFYWMEGERLLPVHFADYMLDVPESGFYAEGGEYQSFGGYQRRSKRYRTPEFGAEVRITQLRPTHRAASTHFGLPAANLWNSTQPFSKRD